MVRKIKIFTGFIAIAITLFFSFDRLTTVSLPTKQDTVVIYSTDGQDDLSQVSIAAIRSAKKSISMSIYALIDKGVVRALNDQAQNDIDLYLVCDPTASKSIFKRLDKKIHLVKREGKGLMHHKLIVIDKTLSVMSSANMTRGSLRSSGNLMVAVHDAKLAHYIDTKIRRMGKKNADVAPFPPRTFRLQQQNLAFSFLPDDVEGIDKLLSMIHTAKKTIRVAMYAWTRRDLTEALIRAHQRGVEVEVAIDRSMAMGMAKKVVEQLKQGGISPHLSEGDNLLHYKMMWVDDEHLLNGSANWTMAAFLKNDDYFMILSPLNESQQQKMEKIWKNILKNSS